ncbi:apoptosis facilitator Bcl-2-like protein 14 [Colius striatus]|uniref:apoptosis facilitator Bcl-2-like protein 14 n=1 Tax=Colius striatus TaxID=57412 RepID=UPI002B1E65D2|nr:apoptosis facilitator Bcl-2-like protein 14 [Colius striatus]
MALPSDVSVEEILLEDDEQDSIEYQILMAYAQRRLSVSKYERLLKNEAAYSFRRKVKFVNQGNKDGPRQIVLQGPGMQRDIKKQPLSKYSLVDFPPCSHYSTEPQSQTRSFFFRRQQRLHSDEVLSESLQEGNSQHQTSEAADVNHIADKLAKLVTSRSHESPSRSQESPSDVSLKFVPCSNATDGSEGEEYEEKIIQTIVSLLKESGDQLEEKLKKDRYFYQCFQDMLSYTFFRRITDLFLEDVSADSKNEAVGQVQCTKVAFTMEIATRLTAVDNHPMNLVLGFGLKYLKEHFRPWIQEQGGWEKALTSLSEEEVE